MIRKREFFRTKEEAERFRNETRHGALYSNEPHSRTKKDYIAEAALQGASEIFRAKFPFVVAWNEKE